MSSSSSRRNWLVCRIALELGLVDASATDEALRAWKGSQDSNLEDILCRAGALTEAHCSAIRALVDSAPSEPTRLPGGSGIPVDWEAADADQPFDDGAASTVMRSSTAGSSSVLSEPDAETRALHATRSSQPRRFRFLREHARGGLGAVSVAEDVEFGREVALKEIRPEHGQSRESRDRFMFEGMITGRLEHPGIVPVYSLGIVDGKRPYYAMRFIRGESLRQAIKARFQPRENEKVEDQLPWLRRIVRRLIDVCNAISYAHSCGVIHRDLKPANIMLGPYGETLVVDWGLAKPLGQAQFPEGGGPVVAPDERGGEVTRQGVVVGTLAYMSPEQAQGENNLIGPRTDVFCLGATLYCVLTGEAPYGGKDDEASREAIRNASFPRPRTTNPSLPRSLEAICLKAMSARPGDRYESAASLGADLERWLIDEPVTAWPEPLLDRVGRFIRRNRTGVLSAIALLALTTMGGIVFSLVVDNKNREIKSANSLLTEARDSLDKSFETARASTMEMILRADSGLELANQVRSDLMENAFRMYERIHNLQPDDPEIAHEFSRVLRMSGNLKRQLGDLQGARTRYDRGIELLESANFSGASLGNKPDLELVLTRVDCSTIRRAEGDIELALAMLDEAEQLASRLDEAGPGRTEVKRGTAVVLNERAGIFRDLLRNEEALADADLAARTFHELFHGPTANPFDPLLCLQAGGTKAKSLADLGRDDEAEAAFSSANEVADEVLATRDDMNTRLMAARVKLSYAEFCLSRNSGTDLVADLLEAALQSAKKNVHASADDPNHVYQLAEAMQLQGALSLQQGDTGLARSQLADARRLLEPVLARSDFASFELKFAAIVRDLAQLAESEDERDRLLGEAEQVCDSVLASAPGHARAAALRESIHARRQQQ